MRSSKLSGPLVWSLLVTIVGATLFAGPPTAAAAPGGGEPSLDARAWILLDARDGGKLAGSAATRSLPIASATKLMTAYVALRNLDLDRKLTAPAYDALAAESVLGLRAGERVRFEDLLVAMMLPSANDAAFTVAEGVAGSVPRFVRRMNSAARRLGLDDTSFANPIGLDDPDNFSSARDLAALALELREDRAFRRIVAMPQATLQSGAAPRTVQTRNTLLLADSSVDGIKTGRTIGAGYVLVASAKRKGVPLISVVLGAPSEAARDAETAKLLDYGYSLYAKRRALRRNEEVGSVPIAGTDGALPLLAGRAVKVTARSDQRLRTRVEATQEVEGPVAEGDRVARGAVLLDGEQVATVPLLAAASVSGETTLGDGGPPLVITLVVGGSILAGMAFVLAYRRSRPAASGRSGRTHRERAKMREGRSRQRESEGEQA